MSDYPAAAHPYRLVVARKVTKNALTMNTDHPDSVGRRVSCCEIERPSGPRSCYPGRRPVHACGF